METQFPFRGMYAVDEAVAVALDDARLCACKWRTAPLVGRCLGNVCMPIHRVAEQPPSNSTHIRESIFGNCGIHNNKQRWNVSCITPKSENAKAKRKDKLP